MSSVVGGADRLERQLSFLARQAPKTVERALRDVSFTIKDSIESHVKRQLEFSGASTSKFVSKYRIKYSSRGGRFESIVYPAGKKSAEILSRHVKPTTVRAANRADLLVNGRMAIAVNPKIKKTARGKTPARYIPTAMLVKGKAFISKDGRSVMSARTKRQEPELLFTLKDATRNPDRLDVLAAATRSFRSNIGRSISKAYRKQIKEALGK